MPRAKIYQRRRKMNLCVQCAMREPKEGHVRCTGCLYLERLYRRSRNAIQEQERLQRIQEKMAYEKSKARALHNMFQEPCYA